MALYEGIALIQEKQAVVLDLGTDYTKFGFTGEAAPRCIVRSEFWCTAERRMKRVYDYKSPEELYDNLVHMLHLLYFRHVLVNPKERKVIVVESLLTPTLFRETLAKVLFTHYEVSGAVWADTPRLCALTLGTPVVLVVALGAQEAEVAAVVHACVVLHALQAQPLGAQAVRRELARLLDEDNGRQLHLDDHTLDEIKVKACFVGSRARALQWASGAAPAPARSAVLAAGAGAGAGAAGAGAGAGAAGAGAGAAGAGAGAGAAGAGAGAGAAGAGAGAAGAGAAGAGAVRVSGRARELAAEPLFARDQECASLPDMVLQCILQCPIDARRALAGNVLVCGGGACLPGLKARLAAELAHLVTQEPYCSRLFVREFKFHSAPAHDNSVAWLGGALCGAGEAWGAGGAGGGAGGAGGGAGGRALARDVYARRGRLRDWVCLLDNTPPAHLQRADLDL